MTLLLTYMDFDPQLAVVFQTNKTTLGEVSDFVAPAVDPQLAVVFPLNKPNVRRSL